MIADDAGGLGNGQIHDAGPLATGKELAGARWHGGQCCISDERTAGGHSKNFRVSLRF
jgi:hypothetical protein